jgi:hypothetical protein
MKKLLLVLVSIMFPVLAQSATYYVAQSGGKDSNPGSQSSPFQTIQKCASVAVAGDSCLVRAGTYRETVKPANNGVTFAPDGNVAVTVSGADMVSGWSTYQGSIYKSSGMNWTMGTGNDQVFVDGQMMNLARWPNASLDVSHPTWARAQGGQPTDQSQLDSGDFFPWVIDDSNLTQPDGFWDGAEVTQMAAGMWSQAGVVTSYTRGHLEFRNLHGGQQRALESVDGMQYRYYLSNKLGALDTAGEWYYDGANTLYLWTPNGDNPAGHTVEAKRRMWTFDLSGRSNTTIKGFNIFAASINMDQSSSGNVIDGLNAKYVWHQLRNVPNGVNQTDSKWGAWNTGIRLAGSNNVLKNCTIAYSSGDGVYLRGTHQTVTNCTIHDVAYIKVEGGAVSWMGDDPSASNPNSTGHEVTYNTMYTSGRHLIVHYYAPNIKISHNLMYDACIQVGDCGFTYTSKGGSGGEISYNLMHDNKANYWVFGIYMDAIPQNYTVHHNVVWNVPGGIGINIGTPATNDSIYNNTVWHVGNNQSIANAGSMSNVPTYNNLVEGGLAGTDIQNNLETSNAGFVDPNNGNFQLKSGSPAIDAGRKIPGITDGFAGSAPDIGAYEFGVTPWTAGANTSGTGTTPLPAPRNLRLVVQ